MSHDITVAASISGGFDIGTRSGNSTKEAPQWVVQLPTAFTWLTIGWRFKAAACVDDFLSCGTPAQARSRAAALTACDVKVGDRAVFAMADHSYLITLATYNPRGHFAA